MSAVGFGAMFVRVKKIGPYEYLYLVAWSRTGGGCCCAPPLGPPSFRSVAPSA